MTGRICFGCGVQFPEGVLACPGCGIILGGESGDPMSALAQSISAELGDGFQLEEQIGRGGYAVVFKVQDRKLDRKLALKALLPQLAAVPDIKLRFTREVETASRLGHPNIVPIYFVGEGDKIPWYVMPLIEGESLASKLKREGRLSIPVALGIARDVAGALDRAHTEGVIHRDVKPDNILLEFKTGRALLMDFGIAKAVEHESGLTATGIVIGTPHYVSPEQAMGEKSIDRRTDVYSLGIVVYEMLRGEPPFAGANPHQIFSRHLSQDPPPLTGVLPQMSARTEAVLFRALAKDPVERFNTTGGFVRGLEDAFEQKSLRVSGSAAIEKMKLNDVRLFRTLEMHVVQPVEVEELIENVPDLIEALPEIEQKIRAAVEAGDVRDLIKGYRTLLKYLDGKRPAMVRPVLSAMRRLAADKGVVEALARAWRVSGEEVQATAEQALTEVIDAAADTVVSLGRRERAAEIFLLADRIGALVDSRVISLMEDPNSGVSVALAEALRESTRPQASLERWLRMLLEHRRSEVRQAVVSVAAGRGGALAEHIGTLASSDPNHSVRLAALRALGASGRVSALAPLSKVLESSGELSDRTEAARAIGDLRLKEGVAVLSRTFERRSRFRRERGPVQLAAAEALSSLPFEYSKDALHGLIKDSDPNISRVAGEAIKLQGGNADTS